MWNWTRKSPKEQISELSQLITKLIDDVINNRNSSNIKLVKAMEASISIENISNKFTSNSWEIMNTNRKVINVNTFTTTHQRGALGAEDKNTTRQVILYDTGEMYERQYVVSFDNWSDWTKVELP